MIPAAGEGLRARPHTTLLPKAMLEVGGRPILQNTIELVRDQLSITKFIIISGHLRDKIQKYFGTGDNLGVSIRYIENDSIEKGLAWSIYLARTYLKNQFLVILGDEYYRNSNHSILSSASFENCLAMCGVIKSEDVKQIQQNYTIDAHGEQIQRIYEKPKVITNNIMGTGTFVLSEDIFSHIAYEYRQAPQYIDFMHLLDKLCRKGHVIKKVLLSGDYVNINDVASLERANRLLNTNNREMRR